MLFNLGTLAEYQRIFFRIMGLIYYYIMINNINIFCPLAKDHYVTPYIFLIEFCLHNLHSICMVVFHTFYA